MKEKKIRRVEIDWIDSISEAVVWHNTIDVCEEPKDNFKSIGYLVDTTKNYYHLAASLHFDDDGQPNRAGSIFRIPKGCVLKVRKI
jgi:hypothetical protein